METIQIYELLEATDSDMHYGVIATDCKREDFDRLHKEVVKIEDYNVDDMVCLLISNGFKVFETDTHEVNF